jgi:hypothetical protein
MTQSIEASDQARVHQNGNPADDVLPFQSFFLIFCAEIFQVAEIN